MKKQKPLPVLVLLTFLAGLFFQPGGANPTIAAETADQRQHPTATITVCNSGCDYTGIADAIENASDGDTIQLFPETYEETFEVVTKTLSIVGQGPEHTIIQGLQQLVTDTGHIVAIGPTAVVSFEGVTIRHGYAYTDTFPVMDVYGGGILNQGVLTLTNSVVRDNWAVMAGGGIYITATVGTTASLTLIQSAVIGNGADGYGGGIAMDTRNGGKGLLTIVNSSIYTNTGKLGGGGIYINVGDGTSQIVQTTINDNAATRGANLYLVNGNISLKQSVLSNSNLGGADCQKDAGIITHDDYILVEDGSCDFPVGGDPVLDENSVPQNGSPLIDAIPAELCETNVDQNGNSRPYGPGCDIGAFERNDGTLSLIPDTVPPPDAVRPDEMISITLHVIPDGPGVTNGIVTATLPSIFTVQGAVRLDPPGLGVTGTLPILARDVTIPANQQLNILITARVDWGIPGDTSFSQTFGFTSTEIITPEVTHQVLKVENVAPVARNDEGSAFNTDTNHPLVTGNVLINDSDANGDSIYYTGANTDGLRGELIDHYDGTYTYNPVGHFDDYPIGTIIVETFEYTIWDHKTGGKFDTATVTILVERVPNTIYLPLVVR